MSPSDSRESLDRSRQGRPISSRSPKRSSSLQRKLREVRSRTHRPEYRCSDGLTTSCAAPANPAPSSSPSRRRPRPRACRLRRRRLQRAEACGDLALQPHADARNPAVVAVLPHIRAGDRDVVEAEVLVNQLQLRLDLPAALTQRKGLPHFNGRRQAVALARAAQSRQRFDGVAMPPPAWKPLTLPLLCGLTVPCWRMSMSVAITRPQARRSVPEGFARLRHGSRASWSRWVQAADPSSCGSGWRIRLSMSEQPSGC